MIGALVHADDPALTIDRAELEDARWITRAEVAEAVDASVRGENGAAFNAPGARAIAHHLLRWWLDQPQLGELADQLAR
jgi:NAD+ diphosphatase